MRRPPRSAESREPEQGPLARLTHQEILQRCLHRDEAAWHEFIRRYGRLVYSVLVRHNLPEEERNEAYQATVVAAFNQLPRLRDPDRIVPWLVGISSRQAINRIRARRRERLGVSLTDAHLQKTPADGKPASLPDAEILRLERAQQVQDALSALPDRCRRLLTTLFFEHPAPEYREIASREGIPPGNIGPLRARCLGRLRTIFRTRGWLAVI